MRKLGSCTHQVKIVTFSLYLLNRDKFLLRFWTILDPNVVNVSI